MHTVTLSGRQVRSRPAYVFMSLIVFTSFVGAAVLVQAQRRPDPTVPELLTAAGTYLAGYEKQFAVVVSEEHYRQTASASAAQGGPRQREIRADMLMFSTPVAGFIGLRDVIEVDGKPVQDRADRLLKLITEPSANPMAQLRRVTEESARYNLGVISRTLNVPTMALLFLRRENQARSRFEFDGMKTVDDRRVALLVFRETSTPRMIQTADNAAAEGRFWIEPDSGRVIQTEFTVKSPGYQAKIAVDYADQPKLGLWVPVRMEESYQLGRMSPSPMVGGVRISGSVPGTITGRAEYQNFRKFQVDVGTIVK